MNTHWFYIPAHRLEEVRALLATVAKKYKTTDISLELGDPQHATVETYRCWHPDCAGAARYGWTRSTTRRGATLHECGHRTVAPQHDIDLPSRYPDATFTAIPCTTYPAVLNFPALEVGGTAWTIAASLEPLGASDIIVNSSPTHPAPLPPNTIHMGCDHCGTARRRTKCVVLTSRADDARYVTIGRSCLARYLGTTETALRSVERALEALRVVFAALFPARDTDGGYGLRPLPHEFDALDVVATAYAIADANSAGVYVASNRRDDAPTEGTGALTSRWLTNRSSFQSAIARGEFRAPTLTPEHYEKAFFALWWAADLPPAETSSSDYLRNLRLLARTRLLRERHLTLVASTAAAFNRTCERALRDYEASKLARQPQHLGTPGERLRNLDATVTRKQYLGDGDYGPRYLVQFTTADGDVLTWFTTSAADDLGTKGTLSGTVKKHDTFRGVAQTVIVRATFIPTTTAQEIH